MIGKSRAEAARGRVISTQVVPQSTVQPRMNPTAVSTPTQPTTPADPSARTYGQVRRRASEQKKLGHIEIEDDL